MAIIKEIELQSGVKVKYHRVASVNNITNQSSIIELASYTNKEKREEEKEALSENENMNVYINTSYYSIPYDASLNADSAYEYIKSLDDFSNCTDD